MARTQSLAERRSEALKDFVSTKKTTLAALSELLETDPGNHKNMLARLQGYTRKKKPRLLPAQIAIRIAKALGGDSSNLYLELTRTERASLGQESAQPEGTQLVTKAAKREQDLKLHAAARAGRGERLRRALEGPPAWDKKNVLDKINADGGTVIPFATYDGYLKGNSYASDEFILRFAAAIGVDATSLKGESSPLKVSRLPGGGRKTTTPAVQSAGGIGVSVTVPTLGMKVSDTITASKGALRGAMACIEKSGKRYELVVRVAIPEESLPMLLEQFMK